MAAGRKPLELQNPFISMDEAGNKVNCLEDRGSLNIRVEDILVGCCRSFNADSPKSQKQELVSWTKVLRLYESMDVITKQGITNKLRCSRATATRYTAAVKLCNTFLEGRMKQHGISGYVPQSCIPMGRLNFEIHTTEDLKEH